MIARIDVEGIVTLECIAPNELRALLSALSEESITQGTRSAHLTMEARDRRELADAVKRGRHGNQRVAGELEAMAAICTDQEKLAADLARVIRPLVSAADRRARSQLVTPSQTEVRHGSSEE